MYCSSCGAAVQPNLTYCNHCGAKMNATAVNGTSKTELSPNFLVMAIVWVFVLGLGGIVGLMALTKEGTGINPVMAGAALLSFALLLGIESVLIWLLLRGRRGAQASGMGRNKHRTNELAETLVRELPEEMPSVTEHTTRSFDPISTERR